jgi:hypothetical protein
MDGTIGAALINHPCTVCCAPTNSWCSRCHGAWYCSERHQLDVSNDFFIVGLTPMTRPMQDWPRHRKECKPVENDQHQYNMIATPPPAEPQPITVSAILFHPEEGVFLVLSIVSELVSCI